MDQCPHLYSHIAGVTGCAAIPSFYEWRWGPANILPKLASNHNPPDLCLPSSQDYRREPLCSACITFISRKGHFYKPFLQWFIKISLSWALVVHACNPSYSGGRGQEDRGSKSAQVNSS
jgi:hypothetical protein